MLWYFIHFLDAEQKALDHGLQEEEGSRVDVAEVLHQKPFFFYLRPLMLLNVFLILMMEAWEPPFYVRKNPQNPLQMCSQ